MIIRSHFAPELSFKADNERLLQERAASQAGPSVAALGSHAAVGQVLTTSAAVAEQLVVVPKDRRCPMLAKLVLA